MSPKKVDKARKKKEIALAALAVFAEDGFEGSSVSDIADRAGVGKGTVYEYFQSKEELIIAALEAWAEDTGRTIGEAIGPIRDPEARLRAFMRKSIGPVMEDPRIMGLVMSMMQLIQKGDEFLVHSDFYSRTQGSTEKLISGIISQGAKEGSFRPEAARDAGKHAVNLTAFLHGLCSHAFIERGHFDFSSQMDFFLDMFFAAIRVPASPKLPRPPRPRTGSGSSGNRSRRS